MLGPKKRSKAIRNRIAHHLGQVGSEQWFSAGYDKVFCAERRSFLENLLQFRAIEGASLATLDKVQHSGWRTFVDNSGLRANGELEGREVLVGPRGDQVSCTVMKS